MEIQFRIYCKKGGFQDPSSNQGPERNSDSISLKDRVTVARLGNYSRLFLQQGSRSRWFKKSTYVYNFLRQQVLGQQILLPDISSSAMGGLWNVSRTSANKAKKAEKILLLSVLFMCHASKVKQQWQTFTSKIGIDRTAIPRQEKYFKKNFFRYTGCLSLLFTQFAAAFKRHFVVWGKRPKKCFSLD